jgi:hypothetical protein
MTNSNHYMEYIQATINDTGLLRTVRRNRNTDSAVYTYTVNNTNYSQVGYIGYDEFDQPIFFSDNSGKKYA